MAYSAVGEVFVCIDEEAIVAIVRAALSPVIGAAAFGRSAAFILHTGRHGRSSPVAICAGVLVSLAAAAAPAASAAVVGGQASRWKATQKTRRLSGARSGVG